MSKQKSYSNHTKKKTPMRDRPKLDYITNWLKVNNVGVTVTMSEYQFSNDLFRVNTRETDLLLNGKVHLQHDTVKAHCKLGSESQEDKGETAKNRYKTAKRNWDYYKLWMSTGQPFVVLNQDLARYLNLNEGALTAYLYYHATMLENARKNWWSK